MAGSSERPSCVAMANRKGGVGKTTVTLCLAAALAHKGQRVLVVDLDEGATDVLGVDVDEQTPTSLEVLDGQVGIEEAILPTSWTGVDLVPSDYGIQQFTDKRLDVLRSRLASWHGDHDVVLIDCPPTLGPLTLNALGAADRVLIVTQVEFLALSGLDAFLDSFELVRARHNPQLRLAGVVVNMLGRTREQRVRLRQLREAIETDAIWLPMIPERAVISETIGAGLTLYDRGAGRGASKVALLFDQLADKLASELAR